MFGTLLDILGTLLNSANLAYAFAGVTNANGFHRLLSLLTHPIREIGEIFSAVLTLKHLWTADVSVCPGDVPISRLTEKVAFVCNRTLALTDKFEGFLGHTRVGQNGQK